ncbi:MAG: capsular polysaccharide synthesis protein [Rickettsiales bacterium]|jgi:hypothetical protein|nr:capsular polysaccharide synthesis protein [Rickettsiales bacterium]
MKRRTFDMLYGAAMRTVRLARLLIPSRTLRHRMVDSVRAGLLTWYIRKNYLPLLADLPDAKQGGAGDTIWQFWNDGIENAPPIVKACAATVDKYPGGGMRHKILSDADIEKYAGLPGFIIDKYRRGKISRAFFSDIARAALLARHGGIWADASDFFTAPAPKEIMEAEFFMFRTGPYAPDEMGSPHAYVQSCFIRSRKGNYLIRATLYLIYKFLEREAALTDYFQFHIIFRAIAMHDPRGRTEWAKAPAMLQRLTHQLIKHLHEPFDRRVLYESTKNSFFQKLVIDWRRLPKRKDDNVVLGSFFDAIGKGAA